MADQSVKPEKTKIEEGSKSRTGKETKSKETKERNTSDSSSTTLRRKVINQEEDLDTFVDLGLGRGVDGTNPTPWLNKSSFQVREVTLKNIIGTEEGDLYQGFVNEVESTQNLQTNLSASVPVSHLVSLGIDSELSRSYSVNQKSVGKKVITRTISFRADFDDIVNSSQVGSDATEESEDEEDNEEEKSEAIKEKKSEPIFNEEPRKTFEMRLSDWIRQQKKEEDELKQNGAGGPVAPKIDDKKDIFTDWKEKDLLEHCYRFVNTFSITHYVYALELGASHYRVMSEEQYRTKISSKAKLGVGKMADIAVGTEGRFGTRKFNSKATKVGHMKKEVEGKEDSRDIVDRNKTDEAVVGVKLQPISSLVVESAKLRRALQDALQRFINDKQNIKFGPFFISCNREKLFLTVDKDKFQVLVTDDIATAKQFYIVRCDEGDDHFNIIYEAPVSLEGEEKRKFEDAVGPLQSKRPIPMYLCAPVNWRGRSKPNEPLMMRMNGMASNSRLAIHSRKSKRFQPEKLTEWVSENEIFFINCQERSVKRPMDKSSYLCAYKSRETGAFVTGCKPNIKSDKDDRFMLFRLIKPKQKKLNDSEETDGDMGQKAERFLVTPKFDDTKKKAFFKVEGCNIAVTVEKREASLFHIEREKGSNYFRLTSSNDPDLHLSASVDSHGNSSSLQLRSDAIAAWCHLAVHDKLSHVQSKQLQPEDPGKWLDGGEIFYIGCYTKPAVSKKSKARYLCVHRHSTKSEEMVNYTTGTVPSIKENEKSDIAMLFGLVSGDEPDQENREHPTKNQPMRLELETDADVHQQPIESESSAASQSYEDQI